MPCRSAQQSVRTSGGVSRNGLNQSVRAGRDDEGDAPFCSARRTLCARAALGVALRVTYCGMSVVRLPVARVRVTMSSEVPVGATEKSEPAQPACR